MLVRETEDTSVDCLRYLDGAWQPESAVPAEEYSLSVCVDQHEIATLQCTPEKLNCFAVGFLAAQGISLNSATTQVIELRERLGVTIVGYAGENHYTVYCGQDRLHGQSILEH